MAARAYPRVHVPAMRQLGYSMACRTEAGRGVLRPRVYRQLVCHLPKSKPRSTGFAALKILTPPIGRPTEAGFHTFSSKSRTPMTLLAADSSDLMRSHTVSGSALKRGGSSVGKLLPPLPPPMPRPLPLKERGENSGSMMPPPLAAG